MNCKMKQRFKEVLRRLFDFKAFKKTNGHAYS